MTPAASPRSTRRSLRGNERDRQTAWDRLRTARRSCGQGLRSHFFAELIAADGAPARGTAAMASTEHTVGFEPADRRRIAKACAAVSGSSSKQVVAKLPFAEDLLTAYYCAFDKQTRAMCRRRWQRHRCFILPFDFVPDMLPILGFTDDAAILATALRMVANHITPEHREAARAAFRRGIDRGE